MMDENSFAPVALPKHAKLLGVGDKPHSNKWNSEGLEVGQILGFFPSAHLLLSLRISEVRSQNSEAKLSSPSLYMFSFLHMDFTLPQLA